MLNGLISELKLGKFKRKLELLMIIRINSLENNNVLIRGFKIRGQVRLRKIDY